MERSWFQRGSVARITVASVVTAAGLFAGPAFAEPVESFCSSAPVVVRRFATPEESTPISLTNCDGTPNRRSVVPLSLLARAHGTEVPDSPTTRYGGNFVAAGVRRVHAGLLTRLQAIAERFPGRPMVIVSGYRPRSRSTSRHRHGRALDIHLPGVTREEVSEFARTLAGTGVGYYPHSHFTHIDVRAQSAYWVDQSGPGQLADYVRDAEPAQPSVVSDRTDASDSRSAAQGAERAALRERLAVALETLRELRVRPIDPSPRVAVRAAEPIDRWETEPTSARPRDPGFASDQPAVEPDVSEFSERPVSAEGFQRMLDHAGDFAQGRIPVPHGP